MTDDDIAACAALLLDAARESGFFISGDQRISESDAAALLGLSQSRLKEIRLSGDAPPHFVLGLNGCRVSYRIIDLAAWIQVHRTFGC